MWKGNNFKTLRYVQKSGFVQLWKIRVFWRRRLFNSSFWPLAEWRSLKSEVSHRLCLKFKRKQKVDFISFRRVWQARNSLKHFRLHSNACIRRTYRDNNNSKIHIRRGFFNLRQRGQLNESLRLRKRQTRNNSKRSHSPDTRSHHKQVQWLHRQL